MQNNTKQENPTKDPY